VRFENMDRNAANSGFGSPELERSIVAYRDPNDARLHLRASVVQLALILLLFASIGMKSMGRQRPFSSVQIIYQMRTSDTLHHSSRRRCTE
jgi:hypothetical protein